MQQAGQRQNAVGQPRNRVDGRAKVTGKARYSGEQNVQNVAHAVLVMSTIPEGSITAMDISQAEKAPGVLAVMTPFNTEKLPEKSKGQEENRPTDRKLSVLQDKLVHYDNQPIGVVVANTLEQAMEAAQLVKVTYARKPFLFDFVKGLPRAYAPKKAGPRDEADYKRGDVAAAMQSSDVHQEHVYTTPFEVHNPMEPHATLAIWEGPEKLLLYDATQGITGDKQRVASMFGLKPDNVRVVSEYLGGGFGSKGPTWSHVILAALAARKVNRPVKLMLTRPQMFGPIGFRSRTRQTVKTGAKADGTLTALEHDVYVQTSTFDEFVEGAGLPARMLYSNPNDVSTHRVVRANIGTPSFTRAPGQAPGNFALESAMDELAYALKMDPLDLRLKNYAESDLEKKLPWSSKSLRECYSKGAQMFGWSQRKMEPRSMREGNELVGWGMATATYPTHRAPAAARARLTADGRFVVEAGTQDIGTGTYTVMTQIAADALGVPPESVTFRLGDTEFPETPVSGGSQTAASTGNAVHSVGQTLREQITTMATNDSASPLYGVRAQDIRIENGRIFSQADPRKAETVKAMLARKGKQDIVVETKSAPGDEQKQYSMHAFGAQFAEVRVDADLGMPRITRMVGVFAAGRILNPKTARSQFIGGMVWGVGMALHEDMMIDPKRARIVNNNLAEYHVPANLDIPAIQADWVEEIDTHVNPLGVKGIGEIGITGSVAAIANAVYHATGKRVRDLPITLDKLLT